MPKVRAAGYPKGEGWQYGEDLPIEHAKLIHAVCMENIDLFATGMSDLRKHVHAKMRIDTIDEEPVFKSKHRLSEYEWDLVDARCLELELAGLIRRSSSRYAAPTVMPAKKDAEGNYTDKRMCGDYHALNTKTLQD